MNVIILAGGRGKRLRPLTFTIPKPLIPLGEKPILELLLKNLKGFNLKKIYLAVGYCAELIQSYFADGRRFGVELFYQREKFRLGTAGPLRMIYDNYRLNGPCLVLNADILTDINFKQMIFWHTRKKADMTVLSSSYTYKIPYGVLEINNQRICKVREKPGVSFNISNGIYIMEENVIYMIPLNKTFDIPDLMSRIINKKMRLMAYPLKEKWKAIETIADLENHYNANYRK